MIQPQHVNEGQLNKCIVKASVDVIVLDTIMCWNSDYAGDFNMLDPLSFWHLSYPTRPMFNMICGSVHLEFLVNKK
jgi:hypothetical protein